MYLPLSRAELLCSEATSCHFVTSKTIQGTELLFWSISFHYICIPLQGDTETSLPPLPPPLPPYNVLVPSLPTPANSSAFPSREPTRRLPRSQSSDQVNHGMQFDIHGDVIVEQMLPVPVMAPQPPPSTLNHERDRKCWVC